jgi:hypothetical protein
MRSDIVSGGIFHDYELPDDHTGKVRKLSELQGDDPLILTPARGSRSRVDVPFGPRPNDSEGSRHPGVHRPRA